jgi:hypothetical protein
MKALNIEFGFDYTNYVLISARIHSPAVQKWTCGVGTSRLLGWKGAGVRPSFFAQKKEGCSWQLAVGSWQLAVGSWQLAVGSWQLAVSSWQLAVGG